MKKNKRLHKIRKQELDAILEHINISKDARVLEIGSGDGFQSSILKKIYNHVISTDISNKGYDKLNVICDAENLPFKNDYFSIVLSSNVLEHIVNKNKALNEMKRVLTKNGLIIITVPTSTWKILDCIMYYPRIIHIFLKYIIAKNKFTNTNAKVNGNSLLHLIKTYTFIQVHGSYQSNLEELKSYRIKNWIKLFRNNKLRCIKIIKNLTYAPYFPILDLRRFGICSCVGFILKIATNLQNFDIPCGNDCNKTSK
ncbi:MAG TPA: class I SAM-dependent methyltransferase [Candidatus Atribacteria bacterium]|nr:class I SAM-dependent methyltransferase [Candidatus Atribacteria bacterium]